MLTRDQRPDFRTMDRWAIGLLLEVGAIHECDQHGWAKDRMDPHAREEARRLAREEPPAGLSPQEAVNAVRQALESGGGRMPRMLSNLLRAGNPRPPDRLSRCPE